jgi:hypothetical protein
MFGKCRTVNISSSNGQGCQHFLSRPRQKMLVSGVRMELWAAGGSAGLTRGGRMVEGGGGWMWFVA